MLLNNYEDLIYSYISNRIQEEHPEITASPGDPLFDLFVNPLVTLFRPYVDLVNRLDMVQDLSNAALMTEDELDRIGRSNYGLDRIPGSRASGYVYVKMNPEYVTEQVIIGPITVSTKSGLRYSNYVSTIIKYNEDDTTIIEGTTVPGVAADYFNPISGKYEFPIYVEAEMPGETYNVEPGTITTLVTKYATLDTDVSNKEEFSNGSDTESNESYANRLKAHFFTRNIGVGIGYKSYVTSNFSNVKDVYVVGKNDPLMERDKIIVKEYGYFTEKHIGGKVDLYIRGSSYEMYNNLGYINSNKIRLINPSLTSEDSIVAKNISNPDNNDLVVQLNYEFPDTKTGWVEAAVVAGSSGQLPEVGDEIEFRYFSYLPNSQDYFLYSQTLYYMDSKLRLQKAPFESVASIDVYHADNPESAISIPVEDNEVFFIKRNLPIIERGTCGSNNDLSGTQVRLDPTQAVFIQDYYAGMYITLVSGTGAGQDRVITSYDHVSNIATVDTDWELLPDPTTKYIIRNSTNYKENSAEDEINIILNTSYLIDGSPAFNTGDKVIVSYTYNKLVDDIQQDLYITENRVITADVLAREGKPIYLYFGFNIKCNPGTTIGVNERLVITSLIEDILQSTNFDVSVHLSDIISRMYRYADIISFLDYIQMPVIFFSSEHRDLYFNPSTNKIEDTNGGGSYEPLNETNIFLLQGTEYNESKSMLISASYPVVGIVAVNAID